VSLRIEQDRRLRRITLAAPERRNVLDAGLAESFLREVAEAGEDGGTGAILVEADGQMFCGGIDPASPPPAELFSIGRRSAKPIVVAVKGAAVSAGLALIANAHIAIAAQGSTFGLIDIREGRWNDPVFEAVAGAVGHRRAVEPALTGRIFSTAEAASWGLIHMIAPAFEIDDRAAEIATALANANSDVIRAVLAPRGGARGDARA
jgi:enoyl-CoA hydratase/carnithine racemase